MAEAFCPVIPAEPLGFGTSCSNPNENDRSVAQSCESGASCPIPQGTSFQQQVRDSSNASCITTPQDEDEVKVYRVCAGSSTVEIKIGNIEVTARVDSGAETTILSTDIYNTMERKPKKVKKVIMYMADQEATIEGFITEPVTMTLGQNEFCERICVAPIRDSMLLGHDLLHHWGAIHDMSTDTLIIGGNRVPLNTRFSEGKSTVARITLDRNVNVPPNTAVRVSGILSQQQSKDYFIEPSEIDGFISPRSLRMANTAPVLCMLNLSDKYHTLRKGEIIGHAFEVQTILSSEEDSSLNEVATSFCNSTDQEKRNVVNCQTNKDMISYHTKGVNSVTSSCCAEKPKTTSSQPREISDHLKPLFEKSIAHLNTQQQDQLKSLLCEFGDVFAKSEFDLGHFTAIEHAIDTGDAKPIKQRMRRTPACFVKEEEAHLKKMLDAGVIQESISEWASAPVLIRKRDGTVRWCLDYRALNDVTTKDTFPLHWLKTAWIL